MPKLLRRLGQWSGKLRRAAADLRAQSGIDDALRGEGIAEDIAEIRKLARGELDAVRQVATVNFNDNDNIGTGTKALPQSSSYASSSSSSSSSSYGSSQQDHYGRPDDFHVMREREYPRDGADNYNALPDNAVLYTNTLPRSELARDALYRMGDANAEIPPDPPDEIGPTLMGVGPTDLDHLHEGEHDHGQNGDDDEAHQNGDAAAASASSPPLEQNPAAAVPTLIGVAAIPDSSPDATTTKSKSTPDDHPEAP